MSPILSEHFYLRYSVKCVQVIRLHGRVAKGVGHLGHDEAMELVMLLCAVLYLTYLYIFQMRYPSLNTVL